MKVNTMAGNPARHVHVATWIVRHRLLIAEVICSLLVLLFSYAAISKWLAYEAFVRQLGKSPYVEKYAQTIAWLLPSVECIIAGLLVIKTTRLIALFASFALMLLFTLYIYCMLHFSYYVPCSCGGVLAKMTWTQHFWFNVAFTLLALAAIILTVATNKNKSFA